MGSTERRERERIELRTKILDAARELFAQHGYEAVTMRKIAEKIEYSATAIYRHFKDKEALILELCMADFHALAAELMKLAHVPDLVERMRLAARAYVEFALAHPNHYRLMFMTPPPTEEIPEEEEQLKGNPDFDAYAFLRILVVDALERGLFRKDLTDPDLIAQTLWAGLHGVVSLHIARGHDKWIEWRAPRDTAGLVTDALIRGLAREGTA